MLQQFMPNVAAPITPAVVSTPAGSCGWRVQTPGAGIRPKRHAVLKFPFWAVMLVPGQQRLSFLCPPPTATFTGVVAGTGIRQRGVFSPGSSSLSSETVDGYATAGMLAGRPPPPL